MKKNKINTFIILILLTGIWSAFFGMYKYYIWASLDATLKPTLELLAGYLSVGTAFAFLVGGALSYSFQERFIIITAGIFSIILMLIGYFIGFPNGIFMGIIVCIVGFLYGIWAIIKNVLISTEIQKTGFKDTFVNAFANIAFIVMLICGSIIGSFLFENYGKDGILFIIAMMSIMSIIAIFLKYKEFSLQAFINTGFKTYVYDKAEKFNKSICAYIPSIKSVFNKYSKHLIFAALILSIGTILSQRAIEISVDLGKTASQASFLLLYSAFGAIIGNILSIKLQKNRWKMFKTFSILFAITSFLFPFIGNKFEIIVLLAIVAGILFGALLNLIEGYLFNKFGKDDLKEYGSATYGLISSIIIAIMMFISTFLFQSFGIISVFIFLGITILYIGFNID